MPLMTAADFCDHNARVRGESLALVDDRHRLTWAEVKELSDRLALSFLGLGLKRDAKVLVQLPNWAELFLMRIAAEKAGIRLVTVTPAFRRAELSPIVEFTRPEAAVIPGEYRGFDYYDLLGKIRTPELKHIVIARKYRSPGTLSLETMESELPPGFRDEKQLRESRYTILDVCQLATTSGSTGTPKCVEVPLYTRLLTGWMHLKRFGVAAEDRLAAATSIVTGTADALVYNGGCQAGTSIVLIDHFAPDKTLSVLERERVHVIPLVPTMIVRLMSFPELGRHNLRHLKLIINHGASLSYAQAVEAENRLGCRIVQAFGTVDCGGISASFYDDPPEVRLRTVGRPLDGNETKILGPEGKEVQPGEVGRLFVRGLHTEARFYNNPELNLSRRRDGFFDTQELCRLDANGHLSLMGREQDLIIRGGRNIYPADIEAVLNEHPNILEVAAVGIPDPEMGERVCCFVVCREGRKVTLSELMSFLESRGIARFKWPEKLEIMESLPKAASGHKIDKRKLKHACSGSSPGSPQTSSPTGR